MAGVGIEPATYGLGLVETLHRILVNRVAYDAHGMRAHYVQDDVAVHSLDLALAKAKEQRRRALERIDRGTPVVPHGVRVTLGTDLTAEAHQRVAQRNVRQH